MEASTPLGSLFPEMHRDDNEWNRNQDNSSCSLPEFAEWENQRAPHIENSIKIRQSPDRNSKTRLKRQQATEVVQISKPHGAVSAE